MRFPIRSRLVVLAAATAMLVASCGTSVPEATVDSLTATTTVESTAPVTEAPADTTTADDSPQNQPAGGEFCDEMEKFADLAEDTENGMGDDMDLFEEELTDAELAAMKKGFADIDTAWAGATAAAPAEIKSEMETMGEIYSQLSEAVASADSGEELFGAMFSLAFAFDEEEMDAATKKIETYVAQECGIDLDVD